MPVPVKEKLDSDQEASDESFPIDEGCEESGIINPIVLNLK